MKKWMIATAASALWLLGFQTQDLQASSRPALLDNVLKGAVDAVDQTVGGVSDSVNQTVNGATGALEQTVNGTLNQTQQIVQETMDTAGQAAGGLLEPVTTPTADTIGQVVDTAKQTVQGGTVIANEAVEIPLQTLPQATGALNGKAADPVGTLIQETAQAVNAAEQTVRSAAQQAGGTVNGAGAIVEGAGKAVGNVVKETVKAVQETTEAVGETVEETVPAIPKPGGGGTPVVPTTPIKPVPSAPETNPANPGDGNAAAGGGDSASGSASPGGSDVSPDEQRNADAFSGISGQDSVSRRTESAIPALPEEERVPAEAARTESAQNVSIATVELNGLNEEDTATDADLAAAIEASGPGTPTDSPDANDRESLVFGPIALGDPIDSAQRDIAPGDDRIQGGTQPEQALPPLAPREGRQPFAPAVAGVLTENAPTRAAPGSSSQGGSGFGGGSPLPIAQLYAGYSPTAAAPVYRLKHGSDREGSQWINAPPFSPPKQAPFLT
ncbi:hypothetical protein CDO73_16335 [Saccharibacillus sp. O23]|uniref:hypothetical protein n=1 Tax=Saccharibacillus sp. O23 TaxID=2009338 RepID=UPI000B4E595E|nr:hypothetical protein [Saccharibacillus sp. O23]OWR28972.1 hypothetical protein CDO73_16335 [Saccharibacillus sp. O23]